MMNKAFSFPLRQSRDLAEAPQTKAAIKDRFDAYTIIDTGRRAYQQDAVVANFVSGDDIGIGVLADGMGGHLAGEVASNLAVSAAFCEIKSQMITCRLDHDSISTALNKAINRANDVIAAQVKNAPELRGMGTTLVATVMVGTDLYWGSVGDSPLYLYRAGKLEQLNHDHSMAPQIDALVASGMMDAAEGMAHPQRNELTSALCGGVIAHRDCPHKPFKLQAGDIVVLASDGIQTLPNAELGANIHRRRRGDSGEIAGSLMKAVLGAKDDEQDNISILVVKINSDEAMAVVKHYDVVPVLADTSGPVQSKEKDPNVEDADDLLNKALLM